MPLAWPSKGALAGSLAGSGTRAAPCRRRWPPAVAAGRDRAASAGSVKRCACSLTAGGGTHLVDGRLPAQHGHGHGRVALHVHRHMNGKQLLRRHRHRGRWRRGRRGLQGAPTLLRRLHARLFPGCRCRPCSRVGRRGGGRICADGGRCGAVAVVGRRRRRPGRASPLGRHFFFVSRQNVRMTSSSLRRRRPGGDGRCDLPRSMPARLRAPLRF